MLRLKRRNIRIYNNYLMKKKFIYFGVLILLIGGCSRNSDREKHYSKYGKVINIQEKLHSIEIKNVLIGQYGHLYLIDKYLIIGDHMSPDKQIHLFDKNSFNYILSTGYKGKGPNEITILGNIATDKVHRKFYVSDHGKLKIFSYDLDSLLADPLYLPSIKICMNNSRLPNRYKYVNDTLCIGSIIEPIGNNDFKPFVGKWNMQTNETKLMKYEHPDVKKKRIFTNVSPELDLYVEAHIRHDLITVGTLDGELKYNIYGPHWETKLSKNDYYGPIIFCKDKIIATYLAEYGFVKEDNGRIRGKSPSKFVIFNLEGDYLQTWETGYEITNFVYDEENNRLIIRIEDADVQFAYLNLDGLL